MTIEIKEGMEFVCDTLRWDDGWEFEHPSMMISPIIRCFESGSGHERIVEDVMMDAVIEGKIKDDDFGKQWGWRGYKLPVLKRRFREALAGKRFPVACYIAERTKVKIVRDDDGDLTWTELPILATA